MGVWLLYVALAAFMAGALLCHIQKVSFTMNLDEITIKSTIFEGTCVEVLETSYAKDMRFLLLMKIISSIFG